jgi:hypothetical protein
MRKQAEWQKQNKPPTRPPSPEMDSPVPPTHPNTPLDYIDRQPSPEQMDLDPPRPFQLEERDRNCMREERVRRYLDRENPRQFFREQRQRNAPDINPPLGINRDNNPIDPPNIQCEGVHRSR